MPVAWKYGLGIIPYFPLESGFLTGKFGPGRTPKGARLTTESKAEELLTPEGFERMARFEEFAADRNHSLLELAIGWLLSHAEVGWVVTSASVPDQIRESIRRLGGDSIPPRWRPSPPFDRPRTGRGGAQPRAGGGSRIASIPRPVNRSLWRGRLGSSARVS